MCIYYLNEKCLVYFANKLFSFVLRSSLDFSDSQLKVRLRGGSRAENLSANNESTKFNLIKSWLENTVYFSPSFFATWPPRLSSVCNLSGIYFIVEQHNSLLLLACRTFIYFSFYSLPFMNLWARNEILSSFFTLSTSSRKKGSSLYNYISQSRLFSISFKFLMFRENFCLVFLFFLALNFRLLYFSAVLLFLFLFLRVFVWQT